MLEPAYIFHPSRQECGALTLYPPCGTFKSARLLSRTVAWESAVEFHHSALYQSGRMSHMRPPVLFMSFLLYFSTHQLPVFCSLFRSQKSAKQNLISSNSNNIYLFVLFFLLLLLFFLCGMATLRSELPKHLSNFSKKGAEFQNFNKICFILNIYLCL